MLDVAFCVQVEDLYYYQFSQGVLWPLFHGIANNFNEGLLDNFQGQYEVKEDNVDVTSKPAPEGDIQRNFLGLGA